MPTAPPNGPELKYLGAPWTAGEWGQWTPDRHRGNRNFGYEVRLSILPAPTSIRCGTPMPTATSPAIPIGTVTNCSSLTLQALEASFQQDLNHNGTVGLPAGETLIEAIRDRAASLRSAATFSWTRPAAAVRGCNMTALFSSPDNSGGWTPIGVEATATGYEVAFKVAGADLYTVWDTDANGNIIIDPIGTVSGASAALAAPWRGASTRDSEWRHDDRQPLDSRSRSSQQVRQLSC